VNTLPTFPVCTTEKRDLADLVGSNSMLFFKVLGCSHSFLTTPPQQWISNNDYLEAKAIVNYMSVVNDVAERGVKLCSDFLTSSRYF